MLNPLLTHRRQFEGNQLAALPSQRSGDKHENAVLVPADPGDFDRIALWRGVTRHVAAAD
jgi:hypothetical protein